MKRHFLYLALVLVSGCFSSPEKSNAPQAPPPITGNPYRVEAPRKRILILPFLNNTTEKDGRIEATAREQLLENLRTTDAFVIVRNEDLPRDLNEFKRENGYDIDGLSKLGASLGVLALFEGRILDVKTYRSGNDVGLIRNAKAQVKSTVSLRVYATRNNKEVFNQTRSSQTEGEISDGSDGKRPLGSEPGLLRDSFFMSFQAMLKAMVASVEKVNWQGKIALVNGEKVYLNAGRVTGLQLGDILRVSEEGDDIYDPETGGFIGRSNGRMKGTLEVVSYFGKDGAVAIIHSGSGFKENDIVDLY